MLTTRGYSNSVLFTFFALFRFVNTQSFLPIDWSKTTYGPDGPWNALSVHVGGMQNSTPIASQQVRVDLFPGSHWSTFVPQNSSCTDAGGTCNVGTTWSPNLVLGTDPVIEPNITSEIRYQPSFIYNNTKTSFSGPIIAQAITLGGHTVYQADLISYDVGADSDDENMVTYPNDIAAPPEVGLLALNSGPNNKAMNQQFEYSGTNTTEGYASVWIPAGYLYNQSIIASYSYGLHIGAATLNYPGSLYLGGYDKGRVIGPYTTFGNQNPTLLDIGIGVETGGSPFSFQNKTGLLLSDMDNQNINVEIVPHSPSLYLPPETCEGLVPLLPIYFDQVTKYYLWNTSDPLYQKVVTSPSYLSFVFPPAPGDSNNVTIKVPFTLLNLTLSSPIVSSPVQYFPCQPTTPKADNGITYALGRAFLQGAFVGYNTNANIGWLAQAPGPGDSHIGLGSEGQDIANDATTIKVYDGTKSDYFAQSWSKHWTALPSTSNSTGSSPTNTSTRHSQSLSTAAIAGIAVGVGVGIIALVGGMVIYMMRKRKRVAVHEIPLTTRRESFKTDEDASIDSPSRILTPPPPFTSRPIEYNQGPSFHIAEMPGSREVQEMPWASTPRPERVQHDRHELGLPPTPHPVE
jgi:hypothetical protein